MPSILGTKWTIQKVTDVTDDPLKKLPFQPGMLLEITQDAEVICGNERPLQGEYLEGQNKVKVFPPSIGDNVYWELVGSETVLGEFVLYGITWTSSQPDAMGAWVCDPQSGS